MHLYFYVFLWYACICLSQWVYRFFRTSVTLREHNLFLWNFEYQNTYNNIFSKQQSGKFSLKQKWNSCVILVISKLAPLATSLRQVLDTRWFKGGCQNCCIQTNIQVFRLYRKVSFMEPAYTKYQRYGIHTCIITSSDFFLNPVCINCLCLSWSIL